MNGHGPQRDWLRAVSLRCGLPGRTVELKIGKFKPEYTGQLGCYVAAVDDMVRKPALHGPTVGILLCASKNERVVRYSLAQAAAPLRSPTTRSTSCRPGAGGPAE